MRGRGVTGATVAAATVVAAVIVAAAIVGCGRRQPPGVQGTGRSPALATCIRAKPHRRAMGFTITERDNGKRYCVSVGSGVLVFLHGTSARTWTPIRSSSGAMVPAPSGVMTLAIGVTGGFFRAVRTGTVTLTSARSPCHVAGTGCPPGTSFTVTVVISRANG